MSQLPVSGRVDSRSDRSSSSVSRDFIEASAAKLREFQDEIQRDLDRFLAYYNVERSHQGYRLKGRTPAQALREALGIEELPSLNFSRKEESEEPEAA